MMTNARKLLPHIILAQAVVTLATHLAPAACTSGSWSKDPPPSLQVPAQWLPTTLTRYVAPGCNLIWDIRNFVEKYTYTNECSQQTQYDDDTKQGRLRKTGGTVAGDWAPTFTTDGPVTYTVPPGAEAGQTITIALEAHDTRQQGDARHDDWGTYATWNFVVRTDCPASLTVDALTDVTGQVKAGCTKGVWDATMKANGDPPPGRTNWNGTTLTETFGPLTCNDTTEFVQGMNGQPVIGGYTFTVGSQGPGDNKFMDSHMMNYSSLKLRAGVNSAVATHSQSYKCCATKSYGFTVTHTCARLQNPERIKDTVTKN